ncbi:hypothetical protein [Pectobacterium versatile]|uniref:hypothetical protein n=1 Tax=Pectobacterium versatile TaxID=2488639 RepID=UPI001CC9E7DD|nr:hypothetical protein [Pectobacterium versatile]
MSLFSIISPVKNPSTISNVTDAKPVKSKALLTSFVKNIKKIANSALLCKKKGDYFPQEIYVSAPKSSSVSRYVFREAPEKLKPYCDGVKIELDNHFFLKEGIAYVSSVDCSMTGIQLPEKNDGRLVLIEEEEGRKVYARRTWDLAPDNAWD